MTTLIFLIIFLIMILFMKVNIMMAYEKVKGICNMTWSQLSILLFTVYCLLFFLPISTATVLKSELPNL